MSMHHCIMKMKKIQVKALIRYHQNKVKWISSFTLNYGSHNMGTFTSLPIFSIFVEHSFSFVSQRIFECFVIAIQVITYANYQGHPIWNHLDFLLTFISPKKSQPHVSSKVAELVGGPYLHEFEIFNIFAFTSSLKYLAPVILRTILRSRISQLYYSLLAPKHFSNRVKTQNVCREKRQFFETSKWEILKIVP